MRRRDDFDPLRASQLLDRETEEEAIRRENTRILGSEIRSILSGMEERLFGTACVRYQNGEYKPTGRRRHGSKISDWDAQDADSQGLQHFMLDFRVKKRKVSEVERFKYSQGDYSVGVSFQEGKITRVEYDYDPSRRKKRPEAEGLVTDWESWMEKEVIQRGLKKDLTVGSRWEGELDPGWLGGVAFNLSSHELEVYANAHDTSYINRTSNLWVFNPLKNRFNLKYFDYVKSDDEINKIVQEEAGDDEDKARSLREILERGERPPIFSPDEFTTGLELLLDTIPLE